MEKEFLRMILPEGLLDHFDITGIDKGTESDGKPFLRVHLTEKNDLRDVGDPKQYESKGFHKSKTLTDFPIRGQFVYRSEEHTSELQSRGHLVCRLLLENKYH